MKRKACILAAAFLILLGIIFLGSAKTQTSRIHPALAEKLLKLTSGEKLAVIVELTEQENPLDVAARMPGAKRKDRAREMIKVLKDWADLRQGPLKEFLKQQQTAGAAERIIPFWIFNGMAVKASEPLIKNLASRPEVQEIRLDAQIPLPSPTPAAANEQSSSSEWNIARTRAPEVWALSPAYDGTGAVVGSFDTGVDFTHPDLFSRYRGNHQISWFDPYQEHPVPFDPNGHGTHTTGTAVGGNAGGSNIGIAPGATWIAAKAWNDAGDGVLSTFHQIFEWFLAPGGDSDNAPDVVNCSWAFSESGCDLEFVPDIQALRAAGIFPVFASGNDGPDPGSARSPGAYAISFSVGATDFSDAIAYFSGRGPSPCDGSIKPDISAPGDGILSAIPFGYESLSGTSMAAPHIAGSVAVLRSINPDLTVGQLETILASGAKDLGAAGPDNGSGAGRLDLFVSAQVAIKGTDFPIVKILATDPVANEAGLVPGSATVSRTGNTDTSLEVKYSVAGTAIEGSDYAAIPKSVTIPAGSSSVTIQIIPIDDTLQEMDETVILKIVSDPAYIVSATDTATITIKSDELISDLTISAMSGPTLANEGQSIDISETTKNLGKGAADPSLTQFYLSTNGALDPSDILIGGREVPALASGATSSGTTTVTIPPGTDAGSYYLIAKADGLETVVETSEANNVSSRSIKIGADLSISSLLSPAAASAGQSIVVTDTTRNLGGGPAGPSVTQFYLSANNALDPSDTIIGSRSVEGLAVGASSTGSTTVTIPQGIATDTWYIIGKADAEGSVKEISESNNTYARSIKIGPDLDITSMSVPAAAGAGESIVITETTKNAAGGIAGPSLTQFYISANSTLDPSDVVIGNRIVPALAAGASSTASTTVTIPPGTAIDTWYIIAKADAEDAVTEISESNNTSAQLIKIGPDLSVAAFSAPTAASAGQSIAVSDTIKNAGGGTTEPSLTRFFFSADSTLDASDALLGSRVVPALAAGASSSGSTTVTIPQGTATDTWYIIIKADAEEIIAEISETNNVSSRSIKIGPDLTIYSMSAPTTANAGQSIVVTETTKNVAGGTADPSLTQFYLSANTTLDASDTLIGSRSVPALAAGATSAGSTTVTIPQGTTAGTWYIIAKADAGGVVIEISESNNTYGRSIKIVAS